ncbi:MAG: winged helix-turn-helix domain-containing protein [Pseudomonadota bacterium]
MTEEQEVLRSGEILLDIAAERLEYAGAARELRPKHLRLLHALMRRPGELLSKRELIEIGWGNVPVTDAVLTTAIKEIRRALGDDAKSPWAIENVHARGYRFLPAVQAEPRTAAPVGEATPSPDRPSPVLPRVAIAAAIVLAIAAAGFFWRPPQQQEAPALIAENTVPAIAVLPLDDMSPGGDQGWFADGLAEEILNELAQSTQLRVASRTSAFRFRGAERDVRDIAQALGVDYVMEGSVRTAGEKLRITVQLIRADDGIHVLSKSWNRPFDVEQVFDVQHEISQQVLEVLSAAIGVEATPTPFAPRGDIDLKAYEQFLRGRELVRTRTADGVREGLTLLSQSVAAAPDFAASHAALALGRLLSVQALNAPIDEARAQAAAHLRTATALAPESVEALTAAALLAMMEGDPERSLSLADQALRRAPNTAEAQFRRAAALGMLGSPHESHEAFRRAVLLDPLSPVISGALVQAHLYNREEAAAIALAEKIYRWNPEHVAAQFALGFALGQVGQYERAYAMLDRAWQQNPREPLMTQRRNDLLWRLGADAWLEESPHGWGVHAAVALERGDRAGAIARLDENTVLTYAGISAFDIAYWGSVSSLAQSYARESIQRFGLTESKISLGYTRPLHQAIFVLGIEPEARSLRALMDERFEGWSPSDDVPLRDEELLGAAAWRMLEGDAAGALAWLEDAARRGRVLRELRLDPLFDDLREDVRFSNVLSRMDETAAAIRGELGYAAR